MKKQSQNDFIQKSINIFGNVYDYSKVNYVDSRIKVIIRCNKHDNEFLIAPKDHLSYKRGCSFCSGIRLNQKIFLQKSIDIHGDKYTYQNVIFKNVKTKVIITCKKSEHGNFYQTPDKHINGKQGCPKCKKSARKNLEYFIKNANKIHNCKYDYSKVNFTKMFDKVIITCLKHGDFLQTPANHINNKQNCPACMVGISKKEIAWLNDMNIPDDGKHRAVVLKFKDFRFIVDGFDPKTNTIYEFYGDYWHGNPTVYDQEEINLLLGVSFGSLYRKTIARENLLISKGFKIFHIWEKEFDKKIFANP